MIYDAEKRHSQGAHFRIPLLLSNHKENEGNEAELRSIKASLSFSNTKIRSTILFETFRTLKKKENEEKVTQAFVAFAGI